MFTGDGFSLNSGFRNILCSQEMNSVLIPVSQNCLCTPENPLVSENFGRKSKKLKETIDFDFFLILAFVF